VIHLTAHEAQVVADHATVQAGVPVGDSPRTEPNTVAAPVTATTELPTAATSGPAQPAATPVVLQAEPVIVTGGRQTPVQRPAAMVAAAAELPAWSPVMVGDEEEIATAARDLVPRLVEAARHHQVHITGVESKVEIGPATYTLYLTLKPGSRLQNLRDRLPDIGRDAGKSGLFVRELVDSSLVALDVPRPVRVRVPFQGGLRHLPPVSEEGLNFTVGVTPEGRHIAGRLGDEMPNLLITGTPGAGKTMLEKATILSLLAQHPDPANLQLLVTTAKGGDFVWLEDVPHLVGGKVILDASEAITAIKQMVEAEFKERSTLFIERPGYPNLAAYNQAHSKKRLPRIVIVIDELAALAGSFGAGSKQQAAFHDWLWTDHSRARRCSSGLARSRSGLVATGWTWMSRWCKVSWRGLLPNSCCNSADQKYVVRDNSNGEGGAGCLRKNNTKQMLCRSRVLVRNSAICF